MKAALIKEALQDLVEKRKRAEADFERTKVPKEIEALRYAEEAEDHQIAEPREEGGEAAILKMNKEKMEYEQQQKGEKDMALLKAQEESNMRQWQKAAADMDQVELAGAGTARTRSCSRRSRPASSRR